jgi:hypothetical protein
MSFPLYNYEKKSFHEDITFHREIDTFNKWYPHFRSFLFVYHGITRVNTAHACDREECADYNLIATWKPDKEVIKKIGPLVVYYCTISGKHHICDRISCVAVKNVSYTGGSVIDRTLCLFSLFDTQLLELANEVYKDDAANLKSAMIIPTGGGGGGGNKDKVDSDNNNNEALSLDNNTTTTTTKNDDDYYNLSRAGLEHLEEGGGDDKDILMTPTESLSHAKSMGFSGKSATIIAAALPSKIPLAVLRKIRTTIGNGRRSRFARRKLFCPVPDFLFTSIPTTSAGEIGANANQIAAGWWKSRSLTELFPGIWGDPGRMGASFSMNITKAEQALRRMSHSEFPKDYSMTCIVEMRGEVCKDSQMQAVAGDYFWADRLADFGITDSSLQALEDALTETSSSNTNNTSSRVASESKFIATRRQQHQSDKNNSNKAYSPDEDSNNMLRKPTKDLGQFMDILSNDIKSFEVKWKTFDAAFNYCLQRVSTRLKIDKNEKRMRAMLNSHAVSNVIFPTTIYLAITALTAREWRYEQGYKIIFDDSSTEAYKTIHNDGLVCSLLQAGIEYTLSYLCNADSNRDLESIFRAWILPSLDAYSLNEVIVL